MVVQLQQRYLNYSKSPPKMLVFAALFAGFVALALTAVLSWYWFYYPWILTLPALIFVIGEWVRRELGISTFREKASKLED